MKLADLLQEAFNRGDSYLLLGEFHMLLSGVKGLKECEEQILAANKQRPIRILIEGWGLDEEKPMPYTEVNNLPELTRMEKEILSQFMKKGISIYGFENNKTNPFEKATSREEIDKALNQLGLYKEFQSKSYNAEFAEILNINPNDEDALYQYKSNAMFLYCVSELRLTLINNEVCGYLKQFDKNDFVIVIAGSTHLVPAYNSKNEIISEGIPALLEKIGLHGATAYITPKTDVKSYTPESEFGLTYGKFESVCHLTVPAAHWATLFDVEKKSDVEPIKKPKPGGGCKIL